MTFYDMTWLERLLFLKRIKGGGSGHEETTTSNTFVTDMVAPLRKLLLSFAPKQSGSGDPSPDNVRPISGWDGVSVTRCGSNLRGGLDFANDVKVRIPSLDINTTDKTASFAYNASTAGGVYAPDVAFKENTRYTFILTLKNPSTARSNLRIYYTDNSYTDLPDLSGADVKQTLAVVTTENKTVLTITRRQQGGTTILYYDECGVFEGVLTASDFEPYAGQTYSVSWQTEAGTVYGGTLDMVSGVLTVTDGYIASYSGETLPSTWISDRDVYASGTTPTNGAEVVYKLATPKTYQLTPQQINTLIGTNVITTDANVEEIIYLKKAE